VFDISYSWIAVEMLTGNVIEYFPDLSLDSISLQLSDYTSTTATLPIPTAPENWRRATLHGATELILLDHDNDDLPLWGAFITQRTRTQGDTATIPLATLEAYFDRRYVGDATFTQTDQNEVATALVSRYIAQGSNGGVPIRIEVVGDPGQLIDRTYTDMSDKTIYSCLQELAGIDGGIEWTVGWEWSTPSTITPVFYVGTRLGNAVTPGLAPNATFDIPGCLTDISYLEDYTSEAGANDVMATSTASGNTRPQSEHVVTEDPYRPTFERRYSPSTSITEIPTLNAHAIATADLLFNGTNSVSLKATLEAGPALGVDWQAGDDVGYVLGGTVPLPDGSFEESVPAFPGGLSGTTRTVGWTIDFADPASITPVLQDPEETA
jgi:hypothetical protein